jgi:hypothetical protein
VALFQNDAAFPFALSGTECGSALLAQAGGVVVELMVRATASG